MQGCAQSGSLGYSSYESYVIARQASLEREWLLHPEKFRPDVGFRNRKRLQLVLEVLRGVEHKGGRACDLGCGWGYFVPHLLRWGYRVDLVDIAQNALRRFVDMEGVRVHRCALPHTSLEDRCYDWVLCTNMVAELPGVHQRLLVSEVSRLLKTQGYALFSTTLDVDTDGALFCFRELLATEFVIESEKTLVESPWLSEGLVSYVPFEMSPRYVVTVVRVKSLEEKCRR